MPEVLELKNKKFVIEETKATHHDHTTYTCTWSGRPYLARTFNAKEDFDAAMADYKTLKRAGINMAKICFHDDEQHIIVFDLFPEDDCLVNLSKGPLSDLHFEALFALYRFARFSKISLDWEPQNFMLRGSQMFYLPTKCFPMNEENRFEKSDAFRTWFLGKEGRSLLKRKGFDVESLPALTEVEVNKAVVLNAVRYW
ncbi:MAG: hypothetical protein K6B65_05665 [Bacilli bacterium]|nr:hypothetical protein [Bacilli bacterium]